MAKTPDTESIEGRSARWLSRRRIACLSVAALLIPATAAWGASTQGTSLNAAATTDETTTTTSAAPTPESSVPPSTEPGAGSTGSASAAAVAPKGTQSTPTTTGKPATTAKPVTTTKPLPQGSIPRQLVGAWKGGPGAKSDTFIVFERGGGYSKEGPGGRESGVVVTSGNSLTFHSSGGGSYQISWELISSTDPFYIGEENLALIDVLVLRGSPRGEESYARA